MAWLSKESVRVHRTWHQNSAGGQGCRAGLPRLPGVCPSIQSGSHRPLVHTFLVLQTVPLTHLFLTRMLGIQGHREGAAARGTSIWPPRGAPAWYILGEQHGRTSRTHAQAPSDIQVQ